MMCLTQLNLLTWSSLRPIFLPVVRVDVRCVFQNFLFTRNYYAAIDTLNLYVLAGFSREAVDGEYGAALRRRRAV